MKRFKFRLIDTGSIADSFDADDLESIERRVKKLKEEKFF